MTSPQKDARWAIVALAFWMAGCGQDTPTTPTTSTSATTSSTGATTVTVTLAPSPAVAGASPDGGYSWSGGFVATINNSNTTPITIRSIAADLQQASGGIVITPIPGTDESFRFDVRAPFNRADVNATLAIPFTFFYTLPNRGREALITLTFNVVTDEGNAGTVTATENIQ